MKFSLFLKSVFAALLIGWPLYSLGNQSVCQASFQVWLERYGASDPYLAVQKTTPWPLSPSILSQITSEKIQITDRDLAPFALSTEQEKESAKTAFLATVRGVGLFTSRDLAIRKNLQDFNRTHSGENYELSLAYVGLYHSIDLFLADPQINVTYVNKPFSLSTLTETEGRRNLNKALGLSPSAYTVGQDTFFFSILPYLATAWSLKALNQKNIPQKSFTPQKLNPRMVVISELHGLVSTNWIQELPSSNCLSEMGITKIRLGLEGFARGQSFTLEDVLFRRTYLEQFTYRAKKLNITLEKFLELAEIPDSVRLPLLAGEIEDNPAIPALVRKLAQYRTAGIEIQLLGLESADYDAQDGE